MLELGSIYEINLVSLEYFLTNKTQNMDLNALLSEKIETIFLLWLGTAYSMKEEIILQRVEKVEKRDRP